MVSKTRRQRQKRQETLEANGGVLPSVVPSTPKSVHLKKTRPRMKSKNKIRLGHESPTDVYEGFEDQKGVLWQCPKCAKECRVVGFCTDCASGIKSKVHSGVLMSRKGTVKKSALSSIVKKAVNSKSKKLKLSKK